MSRKGAARRVVPQSVCKRFVSCQERQSVLVFRKDVFSGEMPKLWEGNGRRNPAHPELPFLDAAGAPIFPVPTDTVELGPIGDDTASVFTRNPFPEFPHTMLCRECGLVAFPCSLIENSKKDRK